MSTSSFSRFASQVASTKRSPAAVGGKVGLPVENLGSIDIVPLMPVSAEMAATLPLSSPREAKQTFVDGTPDILEGDRLVVGGDEFVIRSAAEWSDDYPFTHLVIEEIKGT